VKEQEREEKAQQVVQAVQDLQSQMKEKERIAQKEHKKVKVRRIAFICTLFYRISIMVYIYQDVEVHSKVYVRLRITSEELNIKYQY